ncbi:hypothetical protein FO519_009042 [Halicephalobus sp. NKZ332]|nr:hypothetical protein FO519_009042 [Halicephalobus sp. NKZ332]
MNLTPTKQLLVRDWKENVVNLVQFPRARCIPSASPFSLKLETFLKFAKIAYKNVNNEFKHGSSKGQIPFIELNGRQHADSGHIMDVLIKEFNLTIDAGLDPKQLADKRAYSILVEESLFRAIAYMRTKDNTWLFSEDKGLLGNMTGIKKIAAGKLGPYFSRGKMEKSLQIHGMGRNSLEEVVEIMKKDLVALDTLLGGKKYFFGDEPTSFDATAFGMLAQVFYTPSPTDEVVKFAEAETPNLKSFVDKVKTEFWPEWDEITQVTFQKMKPAKGLVVKDWKENIINLIQFPRAKCIPSPSPYVLKLETFLKLVKLPYKNVSNDFKVASSKGQIPFIELNGRQHADSGHIMEFLIKELSLPIDSKLSTKQLSEKRAYTILLEESFIKGLVFLRFQDAQWMFTEEKGMLGNVNSKIKKVIMNKVAAHFMSKSVLKNLKVAGIGRNSDAEIVEIMKKDLVALDTLLGGKKYFFGDEPTSFDATAFGMLGQLFYTPLPTDEVTKFAETETPNLKSFVERIKAEFWPEWDEITQGLLMNPKTPEEKAAEAEAAAKKAEDEAKKAEAEVKKAES